MRQDISPMKWPMLIANFAAARQHAGSMLNAEELAKRAAQVAESNSSNRADTNIQQPTNGDSTM